MAFELKQKLKHEVIADDLRNNIIAGKIPAGEYIPSQNELVSRYGAALGTVRQAINTLAAEGWVVPQRGKGVLVSGREKPVETAQRRKMVGFAIVGRVRPEDELGNQILIRSVCPVFQAAGMTVSFGVFESETASESNYVEGFDDFLEQLSCVIVYGSVSECVLEHLQKHDIKAAVIGFPVKETPLLANTYHVCCDPDMAGYSAGQELGLHGHRKVGFVDVSECEGSRIILAGFNRACSDYDIENCFSATQPTPAEELLVAEQIAGTPELTAVAVIGDMHATRLIINLSEFDVRVPDDKSIISFGQLPREFIPERRLTRICENIDEMGRKTAELLLAETNSVVHKSIAARFEKGQTLKVLE